MTAAEFWSRQRRFWTLVHHGPDYVPKTSKAELARVLAMMDGPVDTSDIPEHRGPLRPVKRNADGTMPAREKFAFGFTIICPAPAVLPANFDDALYEAGCDDATVCVTGGVVRLLFSREAETLGRAIGSAIDDVVRAGMGLVVAKVEVGERME